MISKDKREQIANRHVARCLGPIEEVHDLPEICKDIIRREMHYCAEDIITAIENGDDWDNRGNR